MRIDCLRLTDYHLSNLFINYLIMKEIIKRSLLDTLNVVFYSGVPATGIVMFLATLEGDLPSIAKYSAYIAMGFNILYFFVKRVYDYRTGKREL